MFVCNCNGIRERDVKAAISNGCKRPRDVFEAVGCAPQCGKCVKDIRTLIDQNQPQAACPVTCPHKPPALKAA